MGEFPSEAYYIYFLGTNSEQLCIFGPPSRDFYWKILNIKWCYFWRGSIFSSRHDQSSYPRSGFPETVCVCVCVCVWGKYSFERSEMGTSIFSIGLAYSIWALCKNLPAKQNCQRLREAPRASRNLSRRLKAKSSHINQLLELFSHWQKNSAGPACVSALFFQYNTHRDTQRQNWNQIWALAVFFFFYRKYLFL